MNEAYVARKVRTRLMDNFWWVRKWADKSTKGNPDTIAVKKGKALFLEFKFFQVAKMPVSFGLWSKIVPLQLMTMCELQRHGAFAYYIFAYQCPSSSTQYYIIPPSTLFLNKGKPLSFNNFNLMDEATLVNILESL